MQSGYRPQPTPGGAGAPPDEGSSAMRSDERERRLETALRSIVNHWNEFGAEHGFEERMYYAERALLGKPPLRHADTE